MVVLIGLMVDITEGIISGHTDNALWWVTRYSIKMFAFLYKNRQHHQQYVVLLILCIQTLQTLIQTNTQLLCLLSGISTKEKLPSCAVQGQQQMVIAILFMQSQKQAKGVWQEMGLHQPASMKPVTAAANTPVVLMIVHAQHAATGCCHFNMYVQ